jgi:hypothetical protein
MSAHRTMSLVEKKKVNMAFIVIGSYLSTYLHLSPYTREKKSTILSMLISLHWDVAARSVPECNTLL